MTRDNCSQRATLSTPFRTRKNGQTALVIQPGVNGNTEWGQCWARKKRGEGGEWGHCGHVGVHKLSHGVCEGMRRLARDSRIAFSASLSPVSSLQSLLCTVSRDTYADFCHSFDVRQLWTPAKKKKKRGRETCYLLQQFIKSECSAYR